MQDYQNFRAGFVAIVGRPNVGKSTLTNALVGKKVAITSNRPETTRHNVRGVANFDNLQAVLVDTPGLHRPRTLLGKRLNDMAREVLVDVDLVLFCLPADQKCGPGDRFIAKELAESKRKVVAVITKADLVGEKRLSEALVEANELGDWEAILPLSAKLNRLGDLTKVLEENLPVSPPLYPLDQVSDESVEKMVAELVREAALEGVREELPHSLAVVVEEILFTGKEKGPRLGYGISQSGVNLGETVERTDPEEKLLDVHVNVYVERDSQKGIIIGYQGKHIRRVRLRAKREIQKLLGCKVNLDLHVRVAKNWQSDPKLLGKLGF